MNMHPVATVSTSHVCSVPDCGAPLPLHVLMCRKHWKLVPYRLRADVWAAWEQWRCGELSASDLRAVQDRATRAVLAKLQPGKGVVRG